MEEKILIKNLNLIKIISQGDVIKKIHDIIENIPINQRASLLYDLGKQAGNIKVFRSKNDGIYIEESKDSNIKLGAQILESAINLSNCPVDLYQDLIYIYRHLNKWNDIIRISEIALEKVGIEPYYVTAILEAANILNHQSIIDKYVDLTLNNSKILYNSQVLSNTLYSLNRKESNEASGIALKLTREYWNKERKEMLMSLYVNMTYTYVVADQMDGIFKEIIEKVLDILKNREKYFHPVIYGNISWYYLKIGEINKSISYLKIAKDKGHPDFNKLKDSKYFISLKDHPDFIRLFKE